jgi:hypothetical protein
LPSTSASTPAHYYSGRENQDHFLSSVHMIGRVIFVIWATKCDNL